MKRVVLILLAVFFAQNSFSSHLLGGQLSIEHDTLNRYKIRLTLIKDCDGFVAPDTQKIRISSLGLGSNTVREISKKDSMQLYSCTGIPCNVPGSSGIQTVIYSDTVTLTNPSVDWIISWRHCCRLLSSNVNSSGTKALYLETSIDNTIFVDNKTPIDYTYTPKYVCFNHAQHLDLSLYDIEGDSLDYKLIAALDSTGMPLSYAYPNTPSNPLPNTGLNLDSQTGVLSYTPNAVGTYLVAYEIREYRNGMLLSKTYRDLVINVVSCTYIPPNYFFSHPTITGVNGTNVDTISACYDAGFNFTINTQDVDVGDSTRITSIIHPSGSSFTANIAQFQTGTFVWNTTLSDTSTEPYLLLVQVCDRASLVVYRTFKLFVRPCTALNFNNYSQRIQVKVYPNPTLSNMTISLEVDKTQDYKITLYDMVGRL